MEKSTKIGLGLFVLILVVGLLFTQGRGITGNAVSEIMGGPGEVVEITTTLQGFKYKPDVITVKEGSFVTLVIENKDNVNHGLHLQQFGVVEGLPPNSIKKVQFKAVETPTNGQALPTCTQEHGEKLTINVV